MTQNISNNYDYNRLLKVELHLRSLYQIAQVVKTCYLAHVEIHPETIGNDDVAHQPWEQVAHEVVYGKWILVHTLAVIAFSVMSVCWLYIISGLLFSCASRLTTSRVLLVASLSIRSWAVIIMMFCPVALINSLIRF